MLDLKAPMNCDKCGRRLEEDRHGATRYCSVRCRTFSSQRYDFPPAPFTCSDCGVLFNPDFPKGKHKIGYCSTSCRNRAFYKRFKLILKSSEQDRIKLKNRSRKWHQKNKDKRRRLAATRRRTLGSTPEGLSKLRTRYAAQQRKRRSTTVGKVTCNLRQRLWRAIKLGKGRKMVQTMNLVGCSKLELIAHLESKFLPGMSWENYGSGWHIDHRHPCASFDMTSLEQQKACFHYSNLQPMWAADNLKKYSSVPFAASVTNPSEPEEDGEGGEG